MPESARMTAPIPAGEPWPAAASFGPDGLEVAGITAAALAAHHGTPLLVVDEDDLRARCRAMRARFPRVFYAVKAFTAHAVLRIAVDEGLDLLVATDGELEAALRAGVPGSRVAMHGNNKSDQELESAVSAGVSLVVIDHAAELARLDAIAREAGAVQDVLIRVIPGIESDTHPSIVTGHAESKFGIPLPEVMDAVRRADELGGVRFAGLHAHLASQVLDERPYLQELDVLLDLVASIRGTVGATSEILDLGGGFGVRYSDERALDVDVLSRTVMGRVTDAAAAGGFAAPTLAVEPGRSLTANTALTLYRVGTTKEVGGRRFAAVDGGMADNPRPSLYGARYTVAHAGSPRAETERPFTVVGRHCESGDVLADRVGLPGDLHAGDLIAVAATGAYTYAMASNYNRAGRPAVVGARAGRAVPWLRREDAADLERLETAAHRRDPPTSTPPGITVRPAAPRDARPFLEFWSAIVAEGRYVRSETVRHPARVYRGRFRRPWTEREAQVLAVEGDRVVGHVYVQREDHPVTRHVATLGIAVAASHRGRGVGSVLMAEAVRWARSVGVEKLLLSVYPHNTAAIALYRKFGFVEEGRLLRQSRKAHGDEDEILMATWLGGSVGTDG
jgi:diaminopimelate decarboxylase